MLKTINLAPKQPFIFISIEKKFLLFFIVFSLIANTSFYLFTSNQKNQIQIIQKKLIQTKNINLEIVKMINKTKNKIDTEKKQTDLLLTLRDLPENMGNALSIESIQFQDEKIHIQGRLESKLDLRELKYRMHHSIDIKTNKKTQNATLIISL